MKKNTSYLKLIIAFIVTLFIVDGVIAQVSVRGYYRKDGTYVRPHQRTLPDGNPYNNYSFPGNYNPNTGEITGGNPNTYLRNYYGRSSSFGHLIWVEGYYRKDGTYVKGHFRTKPDGILSNNLSYERNLDNRSTHVDYDKLNTVFTNQQVLKIQRELKLQGYYDGKLDGNFGPKTLGALNNLYNDFLDSIPENASIDYSGTGWDCNRGYYKSGESCYKVKMPANASLDIWGTGWDCNRGYYKSGESCYKVKMPANASLDIWGTGWDCNRGYYKSGESCYKVKMPANASLDVWGTGWDCNRGYYKSGESCHKVKIPVNAILNYSGDGWVCKSGFSKKGKSCIRL